MSIRYSVIAKLQEAFEAAQALESPRNGYAGLVGSYEAIILGLLRDTTVEDHDYVIEQLNSTIARLKGV